MRVITFISIVLLGILSSCSVEPQAIQYGNDACHFCKMTIVDKQHAAEAVTAKGKVFKYDAGECLINDLKQKEDVEMAFLLVNDYANPGDLVDVNSATFLISENIKSPMGANLTAFSSNTEADKALDQHGGDLFNWANIQQKIK